MSGLVRRLLAGAATLLCVYAITFLMVVSIPGNPLQTGERRLSPEIEQSLRSRYNMDNNFAYFFEFLGGALRGDFGPSFSYQEWTCSQIIASALPVSMLIGLLAVLLAVLVGVPLGVIGAARRHSLADAGCMAVTLIGISVPTFVTGSILLGLFAVRLKVAPIGGWGTLGHLPLPVITLSLPFIAYIARLTRVGMIDSLSSEFIRMAVAKGLPQRTVVWKHALKSAFLPVLSYLGPATAQAMTGSFVVEKVFGVPGLGQHFVNAALNRDPGLILSTVLVFSAMLIVFNLLVDSVYPLLDPRIRRAV